jgi:spore coat polysaccharide biosynthesis predicted glycosyltransferase SpsG
MALAEAWMIAGGRATCLVAEAPVALTDRLAAAGIEVVQVPARHPDPSDAAASRVAAADSTSRLVLDAPWVDIDYLRNLGAIRQRVLVIDDTALLSDYPVGIVLNQNAHADRAAYPARSAGTRYLLGLRYVVLRPEFSSGPPARTIPAQGRRVLVTFGGADPHGLTLRTVAALGRLPVAIRHDLVARVIVGAANPQAPIIGAAIQASQIDATFEFAVDDMPGRMAWADLAIVSGGTTVWELARSGCPAIVVEAGPSEAFLIRGLEQIGLFDSIGSAAELNDVALARAIALRLNDEEWRARMARLGPRLVDGGGARRVLDELARAEEVPEKIHDVG